MEQMNNTMLSMLQTMTNPNDLSKSTGKDSGGAGDFQKLLDQKTQSTKAESPKGEQSKPTNDNNSTPTAEKQDAPVQEDAQTMAKRLMQAGLVVVDPSSVSSALIAEELIPTDGTPLTVIQVNPKSMGELVTPVVTEENPAQMMGDQLQGQAQGEMVTETQEEPVIQTQQAPEMEVKVEEKVTQTVQTDDTQAQTQDDGDVEVKETQQAPQQIFKDVETTPIKVGETYQAQEPEVAQQIDTQLTQALAKGESMVRVQLNPEALGTVTVEVRQNADGILHIVLSAHSSETRGLLERSASHLQGLLANRTQQNVQVEVQHQEESQQGHNHDYDGHNGHNSQEEQEQRRQKDQKDASASVDFAQQLRLGLIPEE